jgi:hypothetical protein
VAVGAPPLEDATAGRAAGLQKIIAILEWFFVAQTLLSVRFLRASKSVGAGLARPGVAQASACALFSLNPGHRTKPDKWLRSPRHSEMRRVNKTASFAEMEKSRVGCHAIISV